MPTARITLESTREVYFSFYYISLVFISFLLLFLFLLLFVLFLYDMRKK